MLDQLPVRVREHGVSMGFGETDKPIATPIGMVVLAGMAWLAEWWGC